MGLFQKNIALSSIVFCFLFAFCQRKITDNNTKHQSSKTLDKAITPGAYNLPQYFSKIANKNIALVIHPCSVIGETTLLDSLLSLKINIKKIFVPEHGFRGMADAGAHLNNSVDEKTGIPIISLYGNAKKPQSKDLDNVDIVVFDLQDVGVRFYTYLSSLHYIMEACAENHKKLIILDRPNPNGFYIDGPILEENCKSFIGLHPIPIVHGMSLGELAQMIKGEHWINGAEELNLEIIPVSNYTHKDHYELKIKPSPNLPDQRSILLYPSLCLFEGTVVSLGRGTTKPFQIYGHPSFVNFDTTFIPRSIEGAKSPPFLNIECKGFNLTHTDLNELYTKKRIDLSYLKKAYLELKSDSSFFLSNHFFDKLSGNKLLRQQMIELKSEQEIRNTWQEGLDKFKILRKKYLIYED